MDGQAEVAVDATVQLRKLRGLLGAMGRLCEVLDREMTSASGAPFLIAINACIGQAEQCAERASEILRMG